MRLLKEYAREIRVGIEEREPKEVLQLEGITKDAADKVLRREYKRGKAKEETGTEEPPWVTKENQEAIKERKRWKRQRQNARNFEEKEKCKLIYEKENIQLKIIEEIMQSEKRLQDEIRKNSSNGKNMWKYINKLRGENEEGEDLKLYSDGKDDA